MDWMERSCYTFYKFWSLAELRAKAMRGYRQQGLPGRDEKEREQYG